MQRICLSSVIAALLLSTGCSSISSEHVSEFSQASAALSAEAADVLHQASEQNRQRKIYQLAHEPAQGLTVERLQQVEGFFAGDSQPALLALQALEEYSLALALLAGADEQDEIDKAAAALHESVTDMSERYQQLKQSPLNLSASEFRLLALVADGVGHAVFETRKREAIREIITKSDPAVRLLADAIENSLTAAEILQNNDLRHALQEQIADYRQRLHDNAITTRTRALNKMWQQADQLKQLPEQYRAAREATVLLRDSHQLLVAEVTADRYSGEALLAGISELNRYRKKLNSFNKKLKEL